MRQPCSSLLLLTLTPCALMMTSSCSKVLHEDACDVAKWGTLFNTIAGKHDECGTAIEKLAGSTSIEEWCACFKHMTAGDIQKVGEGATDCKNPYALEATLAENVAGCVTTTTPTTTTTTTATTRTDTTTTTTTTTTYTGTTLTITTKTATSKTTTTTSGTSTSTSVTSTTTSRTVTTKTSTATTATETTATATTTTTTMTTTATTTTTTTTTIPLAVLKEGGASARDLHRNNGADAETLASLGYTVQEVERAGLSPEEIAAVAQDFDDATAADFKAVDGMTAALLKRNGFAPLELVAAGYTAAELGEAGYSSSVIAAASTAYDNSLNPDDAASSTTTIVGVAVAVVVLVVVGAVVFAKKSQAGNSQSGGGAAGGMASFDNPMYASGDFNADVSMSPSAGYAPTNPAGYMDVGGSGGGNGGGNGGGYMDVAGSNGSGANAGYSDVAPGGEGAFGDLDFGSSDEEV